MSQLFTLPDGRRLAFDAYGPATGTPLLFFHGIPSSRLDWLLLGSEALAQKLDLRVVAVDRPGIGGSDFQPHRRLTDWPADVSALANALGLRRFAVLGYSGGGPYALACARLIPERLTAVGVVSSEVSHDVPGATAGMSASSRQFFMLCSRAPWLGRGMLLLMDLSAHRDPRRFMAEMNASLPEPDRQMMARPDKREAFIATLFEALGQGTRGPQVDAALAARPWGFHPGEIAVPIHLWQGEVDQNAPVAMGRYLASAIPDCRAAFYPNEGHVSLIANHADEILGVLIAASRETLALTP